MSTTKETHPFDQFIETYVMAEATEVISVDEAEKQILALSETLLKATNGAISATYRCITCKKLSTDHPDNNVKGCNLRSSGLDPEAHANDVNKQFSILRQCVPAMTASLSKTASSPTSLVAAKEKVIQEKEKVIREREMELQRKDDEVKQKTKEIDGWKRKVDAEAMKMVAANQRFEY